MSTEEHMKRAEEMLNDPRDLDQVDVMFLQYIHGRSMSLPQLEIERLDRIERRWRHGLGNVDAVKGGAR